jgi:hypothetical protein
LLLNPVCETLDWQSTFDYAEGFDRVQEKRLKATSEKQFKTTAATWTQIFHILFPNDHESTYPPQRKSQCLKTFPTGTQSNLTVRNIDYRNLQVESLFDEMHVQFVQHMDNLIQERLPNASFMTGQYSQHPHGALASFSAFIHSLANEVFHSIREDVFRRVEVSDLPPAPPQSTTDNAHQFQWFLSGYDPDSTPGPSALSTFGPGNELAGDPFQVQPFGMVQGNSGTATDPVIPPRYSLMPDQAALAPGFGQAAPPLGVDGMVGYSASMMDGTHQTDSGAENGEEPWIQVKRIKKQS